MTPALEWRFWIGSDIGRRAQRQLGPGRELVRSPVDVAARESAAAIHAGEPLLFETTFIAGPYTARADALRRVGGEWELIEVKSAKVPEELRKLDSDHIDDLAYTAFVGQGAGVRFSRFILMLINRDYRLGGSAPLMSELDVTEQVRERAQLFTDAAPEIAAVLLADLEPPGVLKYVCRKCDYFESCVGAGIPDPLFDIPRLLEKKFETLKPYGRISAIPPGENLTEIQERVVRVIRSRAPEQDPVALARLRTARWPIYYLDFEGVGPAVPWFDEVEPYEQIPFQYSIDRVDGPGKDPIHLEYLAPNSGDWRPELCARLLDDLGDRGAIVVYSGYEKRVLNYLMRAVPAEQARLEGALERLFDLEPIVREGYCHPEFRGKSSIKYVLPAMVPSHSYDGLAIQGGEDASAIFALMRIGSYDGTAESKHRRDLLRYCGMDTMAMLKVHEALLELERSEK